MRLPSLLLLRVGFAIVAALGSAPACFAQSDGSEPLPTCQPSVPTPPPGPPERPGGLLAERPPNPPIADAPLPPQRPTDLPKPNAEAAPSPAIETSPTAPAPLQLKVEASPAERPSCTPSLTKPDAPLPPERPGSLKPSAAPVVAPLAPVRPPDAPPFPAPPEEAPLPPSRPAELSGEQALKLNAVQPEDTACLASLDALGVKYAKLAAITNGQCSVPHPLSVSALGNGIGIGAPTTMVCHLTEKLMHWTEQVRQIAEKEFGDTLKSYSLGGTYVCRGQNHEGEAPLSEHSFANAVDVMGFTFAKRAPILVGALPEGSKEAAFLAAVRAKACDDFSTVLGPGTDEHHANHLHLDERERKQGHRICQ